MAGVDTFIRGPDLLPVCDGEVGEGGDVLSVVAEHGFDFGELPAEHGLVDVVATVPVLTRAGRSPNPHPSPHVCVGIGMSNPPRQR
jgi:hypothetical protein